MTGRALKWQDTELLGKLQAAPAKADRALIAIMAFHAPQATAWMRSNAPWRDQTGNARNGLFSQPFSNKPNYGIILAHRVPYGIWLEVRWSGRYAVIGPAVQTQGPEVMRSCSLLFARVFGGG